MREQRPALLERDRVRTDDADLLERDRLARDEEVPDRERRLRDDRDRRVEEQVVRLRDGSRERALDRQHAVRGPALDGGPDDLGERVHGDELRREREEALGRGRAVCARATRVCDRGHRKRSCIWSPQRSQYVAAAHFVSARSRGSGRSQLQRSTTCCCFRYTIGSRLGVGRLTL